MDLISFTVFKGGVNFQVDVYLKPFFPFRVQLISFFPQIYKYLRFIYGLRWVAGEGLSRQRGSGSEDPTLCRTGVRYRVLVDSQTRWSLDSLLLDRSVQSEGDTLPGGIGVRTQGHILGFPLSESPSSTGRAHSGRRCRGTRQTTRTPRHPTAT